MKFEVETDKLIDFSVTLNQYFLCQMIYQQDGRSLNYYLEQFGHFVNKGDFDKLIEKDYNDTNVMKLSDYLKKKKYEKKKVDNFDKSNLSYIEVDLIVSDIINQINMQIEKNIYIDSINPEGIYIINNNYILLDFDYSKKKIDIYEKLLIFIETILDSDIETIKDTIKNTLLYKIIINLQESRIMEIY